MKLKVDEFVIEYLISIVSNRCHFVFLHPQEGAIPVLAILVLNESRLDMHDILFHGVYVRKKRSRQILKNNINAGMKI